MGGLILAVFLLPGRGVRRGPAGASRVLIATGAASLGLDLLLLLAYQARVGLLQAGLGLLLGAFLGGTAFGAAIGRRLDPEPPRLAAACLLQAAVGGLVLLLLPSLPIGPAAAASLLYAALAFALGIACGLPFPAVARATSAASAWAADSIGGILGAALVLAVIGWGITAAGIALIALPLLATTRLLGSSARNRGSRRP